MNIVYIVLGIASIPAMLILSNLFCSGFREAKGVALLLSDEALLRQAVTKALLASPPADIARFAKAPYAASMQAFEVADAAAHVKGRAMLRIAIGAVLVGSGVVGFLGLGWFGLVLPIINLVIMQSTFVGSTQGAPDQSATSRAVEHVQVRALILHRWRASDARQAASWLNGNPQLAVLAKHVEDLA